MKFDHVGLACRDIGATESFFAEHFDFVTERVLGDPGPDQVILLRHPADGVALELFVAEQDTPVPAAEGAGPATPGLRHLAFKVDNVDHALRRLGDSVVVTLGPMDFDDLVPGWRSVWVRDLDGRIIEITQGYQSPAKTQPTE